MGGDSIPGREFSVSKALRPHDALRKDQQWEGSHSVC